jgi:hypothetical protein
MHLILRTAGAGLLRPYKNNPKSNSSGARRRLAPNVLAPKERTNELRPSKKMTNELRLPRLRFPKLNLPCVPVGEPSEDGRRQHREALPASRRFLLRQRAIRWHWSWWFWRFHSQRLGLQRFW